MRLAPIVLFVYNRPEHTRKTLETLMANELADRSELIVFADGPKQNACENDLIKIEEVRGIIREKPWCKSVEIIESKLNKGLADSIIEGVTRIVNEFGKIIVLEDDIVTSPGFLNYMNDALNFYENEEKVMHISGYMYQNTTNLPETFFFNVPLCWGWATWERAWQNFNTNTQQLYDHFEKLDRWKEFNKFGGNYLKSQLVANMTGDLKTWFIKWHASCMIKNGLTLFPRQSLVSNIGFDNSGEHCESSDKFMHKDLAPAIFVKKIKLKENHKAKKIIVEFYQGRQKRIFFIRRLIPLRLKLWIRSLSFQVLKILVPEVTILRKNINWDCFTDRIDIQINKKIQLNSPFDISSTIIGDYTYIASNSIISLTDIGKFCSIGPNFVCGRGIHPTNGISTSPMFYSTMKQNGTTLCKTNKFEERKSIVIGNDVYIGANVMILDGITIGDGAVIGAGAVVSKNIPPYAIAVGVPIKIIKYRFNHDQISKLLHIKWWDFEGEKLKDVEILFFEIDKFLEKYD